MGTLTAQQLVQLAADFNALANSDRSMLNDPSLDLPPEAADALTKHLTDLSTLAATIAAAGASAAFEDSDAAFSSINGATQQANATVARLRGTVAKIDSIVNVLGAAVSLGVAFGTGNVPAILGAADKLRQAAQT